jgi:hypothetical protein
LTIENKIGRFFDRIANDVNFGGIASTDEEGRRIMDTFAGKKH